MHFEHGRARRRKGLIPSRADVLWLGNLDTQQTDNAGSIQTEG
jgi:hypothetical protein